MYKTTIAFVLLAVAAAGAQERFGGSHHVPAREGVIPPLKEERMTIEYTASSGEANIVIVAGRSGSNQFEQIVND